MLRMVTRKHSNRMPTARLPTVPRSHVPLFLLYPRYTCPLWYTHVPSIPPLVYPLPQKAPGIRHTPSPQRELGPVLHMPWKRPGISYAHTHTPSCGQKDMNRPSRTACSPSSLRPKVLQQSDAQMRSSYEC